MITRNLVIVIGMLFILSLAEMSYGDRRVVVNGIHMNNAQIQLLEQANCGHVPNGNYWLNTNTGTWGYSGDPRPMGYIGSNCYSQVRQPSLSERGLLYSPGELLR